MNPEDALNHPEDDEPAAGRYRRIATDALACRSKAAEVLDWAFNADADAADIKNVVPLANCWLRLAEITYKQTGGE